MMRSKLAQLFAQSDEIVRLLAIIELAQKTLAKLLEHLRNS